MKRFIPAYLALFVVLCRPIFGLHLNTSPSMPYGLYRQISTNPRSIRHGDIVRICLDGETATLTAARRYVHTGWATGCPENLISLLKPVAALPGDRISFSADGIQVNGQFVPNSQRLLFDGQNRPMPQPTDGIVAPETLWVLATNVNSWDSRYYGAIPFANVRGIVRPFLTFGGI